MTPAKRATRLVFLLAALGCVGCDQITKEIARAHLTGAASASLAFGTVHFALSENPGAFLSLGSSLPRATRQVTFLIGVPLILLAVCFTFLRQPAPSTLDTLGLAFVTGGGIGNWLDRLLQAGVVTDFVRVGIGPLHTGIFNVADVAILLGVALLLASQRRGSVAKPA